MNAIEILQMLVRKESITPNESGIFADIRALLPEFTFETLEKNGVHNLFGYRDFGNAGADSLHLCFAGHVDVVSAGSGWSVAPFSGVQSGDFVYGRGTQDMKGGVAAFVAALGDESNFRDFKGRISLLLTSDEEGDAIYGTQEMLKNLKARDMLPHYAIVAEPTAEKWVGDTIKIGRRGSINGIVRIKGVQGHVAYPSKCDNPVDKIAPLLPKIAGVELDSGDSHFEPSRIVITDIRGGLEAVNITPSELKLMFNVRNSTKTTKESLRNYLEDVLADVPHELELKASSFAFLTKPDSRVIQIMRDVLQQRGCAPTLSTGGGTSDAKYFAAFGVDVVECGVCNDRIHAVDERVHVREIEDLVAIFAQVIRAFGSAQ